MSERCQNSYGKIFRIVGKKRSTKINKDKFFLWADFMYQIKRHHI